MDKYKKKKSRGSKLGKIAEAGSDSSAFIGPGNPGRSGSVSAPSHPSPSYIKYKDLSKADVHEGPATYGVNTYQDAPGTSVSNYSVATKRGHSKSNFIFQGTLYQINNSSGTSYSKVSK